ncbi:MAG: hypothetical protein M3072_04175, partial [Candidatus Dormibacteraeota bacterium]|nr:hypothetical protein [Candidatus Dormibacteraeota bacterium]
RAFVHGSSNPFRAGCSGSARPAAAARDVQDRMAALVRVTEVDENIEGVIETIADTLGTFQLSAPTSPPPALRVEDAST